MSTRRLLVVGLGLYLLALLASAPATWLDTSLVQASRGQLRLVQANGTLWSGSGQIELRTSLGRRSWAVPVRWQLLPSTMLAGRMGFEIELAAHARPFELSLQRTGLELRNLSLTLPAAVLARFDSRMMSLGLDGELQLRTTRLAISPERLDGSALLQWRNAASGLSTVSPLGDYQLRLDGHGSSLRLRLQTLKGPLQLDGNGHWQPGNHPELTAIARVPASLQAQLAPLLRLIATERSDGSFRFQPLR